jgi:hypothetical protein
LPKSFEAPSFFHHSGRRLIGGDCLRRSGLADASKQEDSDENDHGARRALFARHAVDRGCARHDAWTCDLNSTDGEYYITNHIQEILDSQWFARRNH